MWPTHLCALLLAWMSKKCELAHKQNTLPNAQLKSDAARARRRKPVLYNSPIISLYPDVGTAAAVMLHGLIKSVRRAPRNQLGTSRIHRMYNFSEMYIKCT
jgi:hypothetical protein